MSSSSVNDEQGDWRRRRRSRPAPRRSQPATPGSGTDQPGPEAPQESGDSGRSTRSFLSFLEPALDTIASFGTPIVIVSIVALVAGAAVVGFISSMKWYGIADIIIGGSLIMIVGLISISSVVAAFFGRTGRYGVNATIMVAAFTGIIIVINVISFENNSRTDVTATNQFSLARSTKQLLKNLDEKVRATAFYLDDEDVTGSSDQATQQRVSRQVKVEETFREFKAVRSSKFSYRFVDYNRQPEIVRKYFGSTPTGFIAETIVLENADSIDGLATGNIHVVQRSDVNYSKLEQNLYTSILVVSNQDRKTVYFLSGHGEREDYDSVRLGLEGDNYDVRVLRWGLQDESVSVPEGPPEGCLPSDQQCQPGAAMVVIAGPTDRLPLAHAQALNDYLLGKKRDAQGNLVDRREAARLMFLGEPDTPQSFVQFMASWGVLLSQGYIRDEARSIQNLPQTLQLQGFNPLDLSDEVKANIDANTFELLLGIIAPKGKSLGVTRMPGAAAIMIFNDANRASAPLASTSGDSYIITDLGRIEPIKDAGANSDQRGPFTPVVYMQAVGPVGSPPLTTAPGESQIAQMVIFGDSDFLGNVNFNVGSGNDFFLNSANYLLGDYSLVSLRPKAFTFRELNLDRNEYNFVRFSSWLFIPGLLGLMAAFVWWVRR